MSVCIFCRSSTEDEPEEHIVPEGLVGDSIFSISGPRSDSGRLVLEHDEVCAECNGRLGRLDDELIKQLDVFRVFWNRKGTKRGKPARADRPGLHARRREDGPAFFLNMEDFPINTEDGITVPPSGDQGNAVEGNLEILDEETGLAEMKFRVPFRWNKKFVRALHKVAVELFTLEKGTERVLCDEFDWVRPYILRGRGRRTIAINAKRIDLDTASRGPRFQMRKWPETSYWFVRLTLGMDYYVDLSPENSIIEGHRAELEGAGMILLEK